jgi:dihydroxy-acid dehydratase
MTTARKKKPADLRSARWFAPDDLRAFGHRSRAMQMGLAPEDWVGKPVIAILNTWSEAQPCHMHFKSRVEDVKRGILQAGGFPMELPALSLSESFLKPTTMLYRNLLAMDAEELLRGHPVDGVVLMGGCDKTTPALLLGAISAGLPAIYLPAGPMLRGNWKGKVLGSGSDAWKYWDERRAGKISDDDWVDVEAGHRAQLRHLHDHGHGGDHDGDRRDARHVAARRLVDPGGRRQPHPHGRRDRPAHRRHGVGGSHAEEDPDRDAFLNAITVAMAVGCSTNAIIPSDRAGTPRRP